MANTMKRDPVRFETGNTNYSKHFNQMTFKGIVRNNNLFEADQLSFRNAKNVYVDENGTLISRSPIIPEALPTAYIELNLETFETPIVPEGYTLVDIFETGKIITYISQQTSSGLYRIAAMLNNDNLLQILPELVSKYHISAIERYIVVFNNVDAMVLDVDKFGDGWKYLREVAEIPVTKRVVGQEVFENPSNQFTESYKEEYIWSEEVIPALPPGDAEVVVNQSPRNLTWTLKDANVNTEYRVLRSIGIDLQLTDLFSVATNASTGVTVMCVARRDHVMISLDDGQSFERVLYPSNSGFLQIASVSKNALYFFFVAQDGVYRYTIVDKSWTVIRIPIPETDRFIELNGMGFNNMCCFNNAEVFSFPLYREENDLPVVNLYFKGPGLKADDFDENTLGFIPIVGKSNPNAQLNLSRQDIAKYSVFVHTSGSGNDQRTHVNVWLPGMGPASTIFVNLLGQGDTDAVHNIIDVTKPYGVIQSATVLTTNPETGYDFQGVHITGMTIEDGLWFTINAVIGRENNPELIGEVPIGWQDVISFEYLRPIEAKLTNEGAPIDLGNAYIMDLEIYSVDGVVRLPEKLNNKTWPSEEEPRYFTIVDNQTYYIRIGDTLYTNKMLTTNNATITYTRIVDTPYAQVPNVSHVNNELYLAFDNMIKITANQRIGTELIFNLPEINNHAFTSDINAMINISTTEVAIFLIDQIQLVVQTADEVFGYRYEYYNTRLSTGVRMGEDVVNTRDGIYTLYPTMQGLAVMNYQALMATTDQVVEYVTMNIIDIWQKFYRASAAIKIVQMRDYVFLTNGSIEYLMLDLRSMTWWQFESPVPIQKMITDQFDLKLVSNGLFRFDSEYNGYRDLFSKFIDWQIESQPLHFEMPSHYKNMKQLIFQFEEASNIEQTIRAQIKLYRKQITYREPEVIGFKVEGYRTFIKRFNYWKINELQWALAADPETEAPAQLRMNGITIKFERGEEVRS